MAINLWILLAALAVAAVPIFTMHSSLRLAVRAGGTIQEQAKATARRAWWMVAVLTCLIAMLGVRAQPHLLDRFATYSWGSVFPVMALAGLIGVRLWDSKETESLTYFASAVYIFGMLSSAAFGAYPF